MSKKTETMQFRKILVPVGGTTADEQAMKLACRLAKRDKSKLKAVYVLTIKRTLPLEAEIEPEISRSEALLDHIESLAEEEDYEIETALIQAREVGPALIDEAAEEEVDLILMGVHYKTRFGQFSLGNVIPYVLKNAPCRVILYHEHPEQRQA
ncbi:MAG: universal stress protein [Chloroflexota bacterium]